MEITDVDALLDRHRDRFRRLLQVIAAEETGEDPFRVALDQFRSLPDDERAALVRRAALIAGERVEHELQARHAAWLVLVGEEVVAASDDPAAIPSADAVLQLGAARGLVAYLFEAPLIEEIAPAVSAWSLISDLDRYPTLPFVLDPDGPTRATLAADLDTGSHATLVDATCVGTETPTWFAGRHLGEPFLWAIAAIDVEVRSTAGPPLRRTLPVRTVRDWQRSPFVRINPRRRVLAGRDFLRAFSLSVVLRAREAETEIEAAARDEIAQ